MESNEIVFGPELFFFYVLFHALGIGVLGTKRTKKRTQSVKQKDNCGYFKR